MTPQPIKQSIKFNFDFHLVLRFSLTLFEKAIKVKVRVMQEQTGVTRVTRTREVAQTRSTESQRWIVRPPKVAGSPRLWTPRVRNG